jgi:hypothetical protein
MVPVIDAAMVSWPVLVFGVPVMEPVRLTAWPKSWRPSRVPVPLNAPVVVLMLTVMVAVAGAVTPGTGSVASAAICSTPPDQLRVALWMAPPPGRVRKGSDPGPVSCPSKVIPVEGLRAARKVMAPPAGRVKPACWRRETTVDPGV